MNNLHRHLAPISGEAWDEIDDEARRTFRRWIAGRRVVDVDGPRGLDFNAIGTGHEKKIANAEQGVEARQRQAQLVVELRVPFEVTREAIDSVDRGAEDADWDPVKQAVRKMALAEDGILFHGKSDAGIEGLVDSSSNKQVPIPSDITDLPDAVSKGLTELRLAGVQGPYKLLLSADLYTLVNETTDAGHPVLRHIERLVDEVVWAPGLLTGGLLLSTRGGDYKLYLGQDLSIGYLAHDLEKVTLYLQETLTFRPLTDEASVVLPQK